MKTLFQAALVALMLVPSAGAVHARDMLCQYDFITHRTVLRISEDPNSDGLNVMTHHEISPIGESEMYLFEVSPTPEERSNLKHISGKLFWYEDKYLTQLEFVDFEKAIHRAFQAPEAFIEKTTETLSAPLVTWDCHRID